VSHSAVQNPEDGPQKLKTKEDLPPQAKRKSEVSDIQIVKTNRPVEAKEMLTDRNSIFGRGYMNLGAQSAIKIPPEVLDSAHCMLLVSDFEVKVLKTNQMN
jgi:hypothetical protein